MTDDHLSFRKTPIAFAEGRQIDRFYFVSVDYDSITAHTGQTFSMAAATAAAAAEVAAAARPRPRRDRAARPPQNSPAGPPLEKKLSFLAFWTFSKFSVFLRVFGRKFVPYAVFGAKQHRNGHVVFWG